MINFATIITGFILFTSMSTKSCSSAGNTTANNMEHQKKYLALGDSYTIGESVDADQNFPNQLYRSLSELNTDIGKPDIIGVTGWTTTDLKDAIAEAKPEHDYDLVTLLIGVNNQYQSKPIGLYKTEFEELLNDAIYFAGGDGNKVIVISIPDYGVTTFAEGSDTRKISVDIDNYNSIAKNITEKLNIKFVDITKISRSKENTNKLLAYDGLHPSGFQYSLWVKEILPLAKIILAP